ncbi:leptin receptor gene-related protein, partial [Drosophila nasuta]|uniref:leptin receptor gene-related protein n=1 Tax=Drosophila nasuta TaxID=42062 RepID=UPI00295E44E3
CYLFREPLALIATCPILVLTNNDTNNNKPTLAALVISALLTCLGMTFLILACAVPTPKIFYPFFVLLFYVLSVLPVLIAKRSTPGSETNPKTEFALFLSAGMVLSSFALPIVLAHSAVITWTACILTLIANVINYSTIVGYAMRGESFDAPYGGMF